MKRWTRLSAALAAVCFFCGNACAVTVKPVNTSKLGIVAAASPLAAEIGARVLEQGGNAVDAAIAASLALTVAEPYGSGILGEGYMLARFADGRTLAVDFRSTAPALATVENVKALGTEARISSLSATAKSLCVPGLLAGVQMVYDVAGTMPLPKLFAPALKLARDGFPVSEAFAKAVRENLKKLRANAPGFLKPNGEPWQPGDHIVMPELAKILEQLSQKGIAEFYGGDLGRDLDAFIVKNGGWLRLDDLKKYRALFRIPLQGTYRGHQLITSGMGVGGPRLLETMNMLELFNLKAMGWDDPLRLHLMQQVFLLTAEDLAGHTADPAFFHCSPAIIDKSYAKRRALEIDLKKAVPLGRKSYNGVEAGDTLPYERNEPFSRALLHEKEQTPEPVRLELPSSTTHFSVVDRWGNAVSWTQTNSSLFGSGLCWHGAFLNNELNNFYSLSESDSGVLIPGKRPRTTLVPTIVLKDGRLRYLLGAAGGAYIVPSVVQLLVNAVDFDMSLADAERAPRFAESYRKASVMTMENGFSSDTRKALSDFFGQEIDLKPDREPFIAAPNIIEISGDMAIGVGSYRRCGGAAAAEK